MKINKRKIKDLAKKDLKKLKRMHQQKKSLNLTKDFLKKHKIETLKKLQLIKNQMTKNKSIF